MTRRASEPSPGERLKAEWPAVLGALLMLSHANIATIARASDRRIKIRAERATGKVFGGSLSARLIGRLWRYEDPFSGPATEEFIEELFDFKQRFVGPFDNDYGPEYEAAVYSLVYLSKSKPVIELLLQAFVPLLREGLSTRPFRFKVARTFAGEVFHLLYDLEQLDDAGDHEPFDWYGNSNTLSSEERARLLDLAGVPRLRDPAYPPQEVWLAHTNLQPDSPRAFEAKLTELYAERGYNLNAPAVGSDDPTT